MYNMNCDVAIVGAGPAGLAAAIAAKRESAGEVLVIERDRSAGGILQQCIHAGFGLKYFKEELSGPEYAGRFFKQAQELGVKFLFDTMVLEIRPDEKSLICSNGRLGIVNLNAGSIVLAMGCRERTRSNLQIPGTRPAGIYTAGSAQRLINRQNCMIGKNVVILGSGDIGMIMARRLTLEGAKVLCVVELNSYLAGLTRNKVQCLDDFCIPLLLSHTVTRIFGNERVEGVEIAQVDENLRPIESTKYHLDCDTLLLSVGLLPENELSRTARLQISPRTNGLSVNQWMQTTAPCVFACGNVVHVNDLVDNVTLEGMVAGSTAAKYAMGTLETDCKEYASIPGENVRYLCPQRLMCGNFQSRLFFRVLHPDHDVWLRAYCDGHLLAQKKAVRVNPGEICFLDITLDTLNADVLVCVEKETPNA